MGPFLWVSFVGLFSIHTRLFWMLVFACKVSFVVLLYRSLLWVSRLGLFSIHTRLFLMLLMECRVSFKGLFPVDPRCIRRMDVADGMSRLFYGSLFNTYTSLLNTYTSLFDIADGMSGLF